jgi:Protein of unknown function (DUF3175)
MLNSRLEISRGEGKNRPWSSEVTRKSDVPYCAVSISVWNSLKNNATALKRVAEQSTYGKHTPLRSFIYVLDFYINRTVKTVCRAQCSTY